MPLCPDLHFIGFRADESSMERGATMRRFIILILIFSSSWITAALALECVDYRDHLHRIGTVELGENAYHVVLVGDHAIVPVQSGLLVFDIADPRAMVRVGGCDWESFFAIAMMAEGVGPGAAPATGC